jgi:hypothetical protein
VPADDPFLPPSLVSWPLYSGPSTGFVPCKRSQQHLGRPDKLRRRREDEKVVNSRDGCKSRSLVSSAPLPEAAGFSRLSVWHPAQHSLRPQSAYPTGSHGSLATSDTEKPRLPDGLAPSEAEVRGLASEPASPVRGEPVGGCSGVVVVG